MIYGKNKNYINNCLNKFCKEGIIYGIEKTIEMGADINYNDGEPLFYAVDNNRYDVVEKLIELGVDLNAYNGWVFKKAYGIKNFYGVINMFNLLLENGAKIPENSQFLDSTVNNHTIQGAEFFELLIKYGEKITPNMLRNCAEHGNIFVLKVILKYINKTWITNSLINNIDEIIENTKLKKTKEHYTKIKNLLKTTK